MKRNTPKHGFVSLSVLLINSNIEELDADIISELLFAYSNKIQAPFLTHEVISGEHIDKYVEMINRERLSMKYAQECFEYIFEDAINPDDVSEFMYSADSHDLNNK